MKSFFVLLLSVSLLIACGGAEDRKTKYFEEAEKYFEAKNYDKAKLGYKNVLQIDPKDVQARFRFAQVLVAQKDWRNAAGQLRGVLEESPEFSAASVELGKLYLLAREAELADDEANKVLAREPDYLPAKILSAAAQAQMGDSAGALSKVEKALREDSSDIDAITLYTSLLLQKDEFDIAIEVINEGLKQHPTNLGLRDLLVRSYSVAGRLDKAEQALKDIVELDPETFLHKQRLAAFYLQTQRVEDAENLLRSAVKEMPQDVEPKRALIDILVQQQRADEARQLLIEYAQEHDDDVEFRLAEARLDLVAQDAETATRKFQSIAEEFEGKKGANQAKAELAKLEIVKQQFDSANGILTDIIEDDPTDIQALILRGRVALTQQRFIDAINDFRSVLKSEPDNFIVTAMLAEAHLSEGQLELAESNYKRLVKRDPRDVPSRNALASIQAQKGQFDEATKLRREIAALQPDNLGNLTELTKIQLQSNDVAGARQSIDVMLSMPDGQSPGYYFAGLIDQFEGHHEKAIKNFDLSMQLTPKAVEPVSSKLKSLIALERHAEAQEWLEQVEKDQPDNVIATNLLGEVYLTVDQPIKAIEKFDRSIAMNAKWPVPHRNKALTLLALERENEAIAALESGIQSVESPTSLRMELAQVLEKKGDIDGAINQYDLMTQVTPTPEFAANNLAMLLVSYRGDDQASLDRAAKVAEVLRGSDNPLFLDTLGWVYFKRGQVELAYPLIREAARKAPHIPQISYHMGKVFAAKNDVSSAISQLEKAIETDLVFAGKQDAIELLQSLKATDTQ